MIPLSELTDHERWILQSRQASEAGMPPIPKPKPKKAPTRKNLSDFSERERERIALWKIILRDWLLFRQSQAALKKSEADRRFCEKIALAHPEIAVSPNILYRKLRAEEAGDLSGLIDGRGGSNRGQRKQTIPKVLQDGFMWFYLDERRLPIARCYALMKEWAAEFYPDLCSEIPSERTFRRLADELPEAVKTYFRCGEKALKDKYIPYIERLYEDIEANDVWIADNHTFDFITMGENGKLHRMSLTAFTDAKSGVMVGWNLTDNPSSQSTLLALRHAMLRFGVPKSIYVDNGSEFLTHDIGGRGHRKRASWNKLELPPTILDGLGIEMHNAEVRNAKAKPIERTFGTVKNQISRMIETFCGGTILERPESLKWKLKKGIVPEDQQIVDIFGRLIDGGYNAAPYGGKERRYQGKTRIAVWNESIRRTEFRRAAEEDLDILLARTTRIQKISRNGVYVTIAGEKIYYRAEDTVLHIGEEVYVRYDPSNIRSVRIYDAKTDVYRFTWALGEDLLIPYLTDDRDAIGNAEKARRRAEKLVKDYGKGLIDSLSADQRIDFLTAALRLADRGMENYHIDLPTTFTPVLSDKFKEENPALGNIDEITIDLELMNANAQRRKSHEL
ncbi:MAG: Mu transposase C-terminal domain-containing protein [Bacteroides sp.]|nr:Mu transposase C-terminal domain-containing protein [Eubacterium sp.]MCM1419423.1 Mu transposase C-terminal domain-containing protein [Roseburia sp.]MCM1462990.1 Mu transposase C-terminal domain-containing protein [Bacteroides sp.]